MGFPALRNGFCGCSLKLSALFASWFSLVVSSLGLLMMAYVGFNSMEYYEQQPEGTALTAHQFSELITWLVILISLVLISFNIMSLVGIYKERPCFIFPYVCIKTSILLLALLGASQILLKGYFKMENITTLVFVFLEGYFTFMIYSYYRELKDQNALHTIYNHQNLRDDTFMKGNMA